MNQINQIQEFINVAYDPLEWLRLRIAAEQYGDAQKNRIAACSRVGVKADGNPTKNAHLLGIDAEASSAYLDAARNMEKIAKRQMTLAYRQVVPANIQQWVKDNKGLGEPSMARLLGHLGHPLIARPHHWEDNIAKVQDADGKVPKRILVADEPYIRTKEQLLAYAGHGAPGRRRKGMTKEEAAALGNPSVKMLLYLVSCGVKKIKEPGVSQYRTIYDDERTRYGIDDKTKTKAENATNSKIHSVECVRCGTKGKPAEVGTPWKDGHKDAAAMRVVGKAILTDLWLLCGGGSSDVPTFEIPEEIDMAEIDAIMDAELEDVSEFLD